MASVSESDSLNYETEIVGDLLEHLDIAPTLAKNTQMDSESLEREIDATVDRARDAKQQTDKLFKDVQGYQDSASINFPAMNINDVTRFVEGMLPIIGATVSNRLDDGAVLRVRLPDDLVGRFVEFGKSQFVSITADRSLQQRDTSIVQLDFKSEFFLHLIDTAKSPEFGGDFASISGDAEGTVALFKLTWQDGRGDQRWSELLPVILEGERRPAANDPEFFNSLSAEFTAADSQRSDTTRPNRQRRLDRLHEVAESQLRQRATSRRHGNQIRLLATANIIADR